MVRADIIRELFLLWLENPKMRFCQLVVNIAGQGDPFYVEDREFLDRIKAYKNTHDSTQLLKEG